MKIIFLLLLLCIVGSQEASADRRAEVELIHSDLSSGLAAWNDVNGRNYFSAGENNQFLIETDYKHHFGEDAAVFGVNLTHNFTENYYQDFSVTYGSNTLVLAQWSFFTEWHYKLLPEKNLVAGMGGGHVISAAPYKDYFALIELTYYLPMFSLQGMVRPNISEPGRVTTWRYIGVINFAYERKVEAFVRFETGNEGYTVVNAGSLKNEFKSSSETAQLRYWFTEAFGASTYLELYQNPFYTRTTYGGGLMVNY